jgi:hypothetical protein
MRALVAFLFVFTIACKAKTPYNPFLKEKTKQSTIINDERKKMEKDANKASRKRLRKNKRKVLSQ